MKLKVIRDINGIVKRKVGDVIAYNPWPHEWRGLSESKRLENGFFLHCFGHGEFELLIEGVDVLSNEI